jgi:hypothetical protein
VLIALATLILTFATSLAEAQTPWTQYTALSDPNVDWAGGSQAVKAPVITPALGGGFHVAYWVGGKVRYRRIDASGPTGNTLTPGVFADAYSGAFVPNVEISTATDGTVGVVWEKWNEPSGSGPEIGVRRLTGAGVPIGSAQIISNSGANAKWPVISGYGTGSNSNFMVSYWNAVSSSGNSMYKDLRSIQYNGASWGADNYLGQDGDNQYVETGMARSPADGSVWRAWGVANSGGTWGIRMSQFNPGTNTWGAPVNVVSNKSGFISRIQLDVNTNGKVMLAWDSGNSTTGRIYDPSTNALGNELPLWDSKSFFGNVADVPGTDNFYVFNAYGEDFPMVRPIVGGVLDPVQYLAEYPGNNVSNAFIPWIRGAVDEKGNAVAVWEHWATNGGTNPQVVWSSRTVPITVPEPTALCLIGIAMLALRRQRRAAQPRSGGTM